MTDFDWLTSTAASAPARTAATREAELLARATLLAKLGYPKKRIEARMKQNLAWEYENLGTPVVAKRLASLISEACRLAGVAGAAPKKRSSR